PVPYLDLAAAIGPAFRFSHSQQGFSYVAFHPDFLTNGRFYTVHSETIGAIPADFPLDRESDKAGNPVVASHHEVVTEWTADDPSAVIFSGTHREVLRIEEPYADHNVGQIAFDNSLDPTDPGYGLLFIPVGDGGRPGQGEYTDALDEGQDPTTVLGSILRIIPEPDPETGKGYGIPQDNPFVADAAVLDEIWAY
ncbi:MAG: PQQ-dependent sugar dehydrogenase, partial [Gammaproteobacteria bacterium]